MRRLLLLFALCALLALLRAFPALPAAAGVERVVWIDLQAMRLTVYENRNTVATFPIAAGARETPTPLGVFRVNRRFRTEEVTGFGTRFLGIDARWGQYGIHGTNAPGSIGSRVSHGCVRLYSRDAEALYRMIPNGTRVVIENGPYGELGWSLETLSPGDRGALVVAAQRKLYALGYYAGGLDGVYGAGMSEALLRFKAEHGLAKADLVDAETWAALGVELFE